jgi:hypothetical protein
MRSSIAVLTALWIAATSGLAAADDDPNVHVHAGDGGFGSSAIDATIGDTTTNVSSVSIGTYHSEPACVDICTGDLTCPDGTFKIHSWVELPDGTRTNNAYWCPTEGRTPEITDGAVAAAFRRIPLPPSTFTIQPPGGITLVNFDTNFFTEERTLDRTVRLLGQRVDLRIEAHSYTWHFDDGESMTTSKPGAAYPKLQITHNYLQTGGYQPALDVTWVADYRVNGGAWQPVPGSVTIQGSPIELRAIEARPTLVGYDS